MAKRAQQFKKPNEKVIHGKRRTRAKRHDASNPGATLEMPTDSAFVSPGADVSPREAVAGIKPGEGKLMPPLRHNRP